MFCYPDLNHAEVLEQLQPTHIVTQDQCDVCAVNLTEVERAIAQLINSHPQIISLQPNLLRQVWTDIERVGQTLEHRFSNQFFILQDEIFNLKTTVSALTSQPNVKKF